MDIDYVEVIIFTHRAFFTEDHLCDWLTEKTYTLCYYAAIMCLLCNICSFGPNAVTCNLV